MTVNETEFLNALNDELGEVYLPAAVFVCVVVILGIVGNIHVLVAYKMIRKMTAHRMFIMIMACIDLCNCTLHIPWAAYAALNPLTFRSDWGCQALSFMGYWTGSSSGLVLGLISINYFRKLCRPLHRQISYRMVKLLCFVAIVIGAGLSWPALFFYGKNEVLLINVDNNTTMTGYECGISTKYRNSMYSYVFTGTVLAASSVVCVSMVTLYILIARAIATHYQFQAIHTRRRSNRESIYTSSTVSEDTTVGSSDMSSGHIAVEEKCSSEQTRNPNEQGHCTALGEQHDVNIESSGNDVNENSSNVGSTRNAQGVAREGRYSVSRVVSKVLRKVSSSAISNDEDRKASDVNYKKFKKQKKHVIMFSWITGVFLISYVLHQVLLLTVYLNPAIYGPMSDLERSVVLVLLFFVYINVFVNWLIYARSDTQFRHRVILIYRNIGSRICCYKK